MNTIDNNNSAKFRRGYAINPINASAKPGTIKRENFGNQTGQGEPKKDNRSTGKNPKSFGQILQEMQE